MVGALGTQTAKDLILRFDETSQTLMFWFDKERTWGQSIATETQALEVRDDLLIWRSTGITGNRTIRIDRVSGEVSDELTVPDSFEIFRAFTGTCTSEPEVARQPLTAAQRKF